MMNGNGNALSMPSNGSRSAASKCRSTCQPSGSIRASTRSNSAMSGIPPRCLTKIEAHAAETLIMQNFKIALAEIIVGIGDAAVLPATLRYRIHDDAIVAPMAAGVDQYRARQSQRRLQGLEARQRRIGRRVGALGRIGIALGGTKNMAVRVAGSGRCPKAGHARIGIGGFAGGCVCHGISMLC